MKLGRMKLLVKQAGHTVALKFELLKLTLFDAAIRSLQASNSYFVASGDEYSKQVINFN
jgi:hypothetical protein